MPELLAAAAEDEAEEEVGDRVALDPDLRAQDQVQRWFNNSREGRTHDDGLVSPRLEALLDEVPVAAATLADETVPAPPAAPPTLHREPECQGSARSAGGELRRRDSRRWDAGQAGRRGRERRLDRPRQVEVLAGAVRQERKHLRACGVQVAAGVSLHSSPPRTLGSGRAPRRRRRDRKSVV